MTKQQKIDNLEKDKARLLEDIFILLDGDNWVKVVETKKRYILLRETTNTIMYGSPMKEEKTKSSEQY